MYYIGIDLGGTGIKAGVVDENGNIILKDSCPTGAERGYGAVIQDMAKLAIDVTQRSGHRMDEIKAIGIGLPGVMDPRTGRVPFCTNLGWHDVPIIQEMAKYTDRPVYVDNDATVAGLAESVAGVSAGCANSLFITLGTGVGGGVSHAGEFLLNAVRAKLPGMVFYKDMPFARVELAKLTNDAGIIGAAMLGR